MTNSIYDESVYLRVLQFEKGEIQFTDATNAQKLFADFGKDIRYNALWKKWIVWNGKYWKIDHGTLIFNKCLEMVRGIYHEIRKTADYRERIDIEKHAIQSESSRRRKAAVEAATWIPELNIDTEDLDTDPFLLNVQNGTIDLRTGELREHRQEDLITRMANVEYDPKADCPVWKKFLMEIMNYNTELLHYIQKAAGWGITGNTSEQSMFILFGTGANGKSTFLTNIMNLLGDYAISTPTETFMRKTGEHITNDIARLRGTRFVTTSETDTGKRLSEPLIKQITGNDKMTARFLYGEYFEFKPTFKIFMGTNHKPVIKGTDHGIWRRIKLIPFTTKIEDEAQDKQLDDKLFEEKNGILNWLIEGALMWQKEGLKTPNIIINATNEYRNEMDVIGNFIRERCEQKQGLWESRQESFLSVIRTGVMKITNTPLARGI